MKLLKLDNFNIKEDYWLINQIINSNIFTYILMHLMLLLNSLSIMFLITILFIISLVLMI